VNKGEGLRVVKRGELRVGIIGKGEGLRVVKKGKG
jgi:hypothetical protein